jgi:hypothetical protein
MKLHYFKIPRGFTMKTTTMTLSIVITLALSSENGLVYAHQGGLGAQTSKNPYNTNQPITTTANSTQGNSSELPDVNTDSDNSLNSVTNNSNSEQPCKITRRANKKLIKFGINSDDIQNFSPLQLTQLNAEQIGAFNASNFADLLLGTVVGLTSNLLCNANKQALSGFSATQVAKIPSQAFQGFTHNNLGGLTAEAIQAITPQQMNEISPTEFQALPEQDVSKLLANLNPEHNLGKVQSCLPKGWEIKPNKGLNRPMGAPIKLRPHHNQSTAGLDMVEVPDLKAGFGLGGSIDENGNALACINETIATTSFTAKQTEEGIVTVQDETGTELAFLPDADNMTQGIDNTEPTIETNEEGQYILTFKGGQQLTVNPTLKDPQGLLENLAPQSTIQVNKQGHTRFYLADKQRTVMCAFSPWVNKASTGSKPGIKVTGQPGVDEQMVVVYEDGHTQDARPAIQSPETFKNFAATVSGVDKVSLLVDGRIKVHYYGKPLTLIPAFDVKPAQTEPCSCSCSEEETVEPNVDFNEDGSLTFTNEAGDKQQIFVVEDDDSEAVNEANNSDNTLPETDDSEKVTEANNTDNATPETTSDNEEVTKTNSGNDTTLPKVDDSDKVIVVNNSNNILPDKGDSQETTATNNSDNTLPEQGDSQEATTTNNSDNTLPEQGDSQEATTANNSNSTLPDKGDSQETTATNNSDNTLPEQGDSQEANSANNSDNVLPNDSEEVTAANNNNTPAEDNSSEVNNSSNEVKPNTNTTTTTTESSNHSDNSLPNADNSNSEVKPSTTTTTTTNPPNTTVTTTPTSNSNTDNVSPSEANNPNSEVKPDPMEITEINLPNTNESVEEPEESNTSEVVDETEVPNEMDTVIDSSNSDNLPEEDNLDDEVNPNVMEITEISLPNPNESATDEADESNTNAADATQEPNETDTTTDSDNSDNQVSEADDDSNNEVTPNVMEITEINFLNQHF